MLRTYDDALSRVGTSELASYAGGRSRYVTWRLDPADDRDVQAVMYGVPIATFYPAGVTVEHHGHLEPSTLDGIAHALGVVRARVGLDHRVFTILGHLGTGVLTLDYAGQLVYQGGYIADALAPARTSRYGGVQLIDAHHYADSVHITLTDFDIDEDHTAYMRGIARVVARALGATGRATVCRREKYRGAILTTFAVARVS